MHFKKCLITIKKQFCLVYLISIFEQKIDEFNLVVKFNQLTLFEV